MHEESHSHRRPQADVAGTPLGGSIRIPLFDPFPKQMNLNRQFPNLKASEVDRWLVVDHAGLVVCERPTASARGKLGEYRKVRQLDQSRYDAAAVRKPWEAALTDRQRNVCGTVWPAQSSLP